VPQKTKQFEATLTGGFFIGANEPAFSFWPLAKPAALGFWPLALGFVFKSGPWLLAFGSWLFCFSRTHQIQTRIGARNMSENTIHNPSPATNEQAETTEQVETMIEKIVEQPNATEKPVTENPAETANKTLSVENVAGESDQNMSGEPTRNTVDESVQDTPGDLAESTHSESGQNTSDEPVQDSGSYQSSYQADQPAQVNQPIYQANQAPGGYPDVRH
jgi:hypothetical protein